MNWLYPSLFWALAALSIPILIHLFSFRKFKLVYFTNVRFLDDLQKESKSYARLKRFLILTSRLLAFACLILAFIQPFLPAKQLNKQTQSGKRVISIFIDNSFSMNGINKNGHLLDEAIKKAKTIIGSFDNADDFYLLTQDFEGRHMHSLSKEETIAYLDEIKLSPSSKSFEQIYTKQKELLDDNNSKNKLSFYISDFQKNSIDFAKIKSDTNLNVTLIPLAANKVSNIYIDSVYTKLPVTQIDIPQEIIVVVKNNSEDDLTDAIVRLNINGKERAPATFSVKANEAAKIAIPFIWQEATAINGTVSIDDEQITFDDKLFFSIQPSAYVKLLLIKGQGANVPMALHNLYSQDSLFKYTEQSEANIDYSQFKDMNTIVLDHLSSLSSGLVLELRKFLEMGGNVFVVPSMSLDLASYNSALQQIGVAGFAEIDTVSSKVVFIDTKHELFQGVFEKVKENLDLPTIKKSFIGLSNRSAPRKSILKGANGSDILTVYTIAKGQLFLMSTALDESAGNFGKHALLVPIGINIGLNSLSESTLYYVNGSNNKILINSNTEVSEKPFLMKSLTTTNYSFIPEIQLNEQGTFLFTANQPEQAGNYVLEKNEQKVQAIAFNYSRKESNIEAYTPSEINTQLKSNGLFNFSLIEKSDLGLQAALFSLHKGKSLWIYFLVGAIVFFVLEMVLLKLFKS
jgi:Aerotolerance regulator N-terminal